MKRIEGIDKVLIIGSGPIIIGQACEFDYSGTQAQGVAIGGLQDSSRELQPCDHHD